MLWCLSFSWRPFLIPSSLAMKRTSTDAGLDTPGSMKERRRYHHHHELSWRQKIDDARSPAFQDNDSYDKQLLRAISLVLSAVGFEHADPTAMESFRMITQECEAARWGACR